MDQLDKVLFLSTPFFIALHVLAIFIIDVFFYAFNDFPCISIRDLDMGFEPKQFLSLLIEELTLLLVRDACNVHHLLKCFKHF